eukprot:CAMPEP_0201873696 /NCGR_PEP_ID=MMETSP0902-20130614/6127_1 /ASSEMBLY_ACC=CAM_ASM_000551 /TAXON_ID=420261 /ORGANISM="Thalassiosira antarctica, Strain CCMP982" /LENGTH=36 /DNA_ID= /DNA_START= /DNA_END= /DNA_ORIENTATION=
MITDESSDYYDESDEPRFWGSASGYYYDESDKSGDY